MRLFEEKKARKLVEDGVGSTNATTSNTAGRGSFSFGNNPMDAADTAGGSGENFSGGFGYTKDELKNLTPRDLESGNR